MPIPTQREVSPEDPLGALGKTRVEVASRIQEPPPTGPVLKAGPMAASTEVEATAARAEISWREDGIVDESRALYGMEMRRKKLAFESFLEDRHD